MSLSPRWLVKAKPVRIIVHWTAGCWYPSDVDLEHYHFLVDVDGNWHKGDHDVSDNDTTSDDDYAAHTRMCNTGSIAVAFCGMFNARQKPFTPGPRPLSNKQWNSGLIGLGTLCKWYHIPPASRTLLMHCEVERTLGILQNGKWDISVLPFERREEYERLTPGEEMRARVKILLEGDGK